MRTANKKAVAKRPEAKQPEAANLPPKVFEELLKVGQEILKEDVAREYNESRTISIKGREFSLGDEVFGPSLEMVMLNSIVERAYYGKEPFDETNPSSPICFAFAPNNLPTTPCAPHEMSETPQNTECATCPYNRWNSDPDPERRGKACKEFRRAAVVLPDAPNQIRILRIPIMSVKAYQHYVKRILPAQGFPINRVITLASFESGVSYPKLKFQVKGKMPEAMWSQLDTYRKNALAVLNEPYPRNRLEAADA
jgi:hypothetical protein